MANESDETYVKICKLQELFHGVYTAEESAILLELNEGDVKSAASFILRSDAAHIRQILEAEQRSWTEVVKKTHIIKNDPSILEKVKSGKIDTSCRLFACSACDFYWWFRAPERKQVSKCKRCRVRYDPIPRRKEWGWAEFYCKNCSREFGGWCAIYNKSRCYRCELPCNPLRIVPREHRGGSKSGNRHSCDAPDCPNRRAIFSAPYPGEVDAVCVHPVSRRLRNLSIVIHPSVPHDSSGSTVDTFLSQTELQKSTHVIYPTLGNIPE